VASVGLALYGYLLFLCLKLGLQFSSRFKEKIFGSEAPRVFGVSMQKSGYPIFQEESPEVAADSIT
jgi:hypothetical protein